MNRSDIPSSRQPQGSSVSGLAFGVGTYVFWGLVPAYFWLLNSVEPIEVVLHRILWSLLSLLIIGAAYGRLGDAWRALRDPKAAAMLMISTLLISVNWLLNVVAVNDGHMLAVSLGYFLTPLVNVALGILILREKLTKAVAMTLALAILGIVILAGGALDTLGISLGLAFCFGLYGFVRKIAPVEALPGLTVETALLAPVALIWLGWMAVHGKMSFGQDALTTGLLIGTGSVLMLPLLLFGFLVRRLPMITVGLFQYIAPSVTFLVALGIFGEPLDVPTLVSFVLVWAGLAIFSVDAVRRARRKGDA